MPGHGYGPVHLAILDTVSAMIYGSIKWTSWTRSVPAQCTTMHSLHLGAQWSDVIDIPVNDHQVSDFVLGCLSFTKLRYHGVRQLLNNFSSVSLTINIWNGSERTLEVDQWLSDCVKPCEVAFLQWQNVTANIADDQMLSHVCFNNNQLTCLTKIEKGSELRGLVSFSLFLWRHRMNCFFFSYPFALFFVFISKKLN